jgi:hypothetical protein
VKGYLAALGALDVSEDVGPACGCDPGGGWVEDEVPPEEVVRGEERG